VDDRLGTGTRRDDPDDRLVEADTQPGERPRCAIGASVVADGLEQLVGRRGDQLVHRRARVAPGLEVAHDRIEAHLGEESPVPGIVRNSGLGERVADHLFSERTTCGVHVVVDPDAHVHRQGDRAGFAPGTPSARGDGTSAECDPLRRRPVEERAVGDLAGKAQHLGTEGCQEHGRRQRPAESQ
jgi:hypothetical protein